jgi:hypothetical protein
MADLGPSNTTCARASCSTPCDIRWLSKSRIQCLLEGLKDMFFRNDFFGESNLRKPRFRVNLLYYVTQNHFGLKIMCTTLTVYFMNALDFVRKVTLHFGQEAASIVRQLRGVTCISKAASFVRLPASWQSCNARWKDFIADLSPFLTCTTTKTK